MLTHLAIKSTQACPPQLHMHLIAWPCGQGPLEVLAKGLGRLLAQEGVCHGPPLGGGATHCIGSTPAQPSPNHTQGGGEICFLIAGKH
jgi:hypothetical protein